MLRAILTNPFTWVIVLTAAAIVGGNFWYSNQKASWLNQGKEQQRLEQVDVENSELRLRNLTIGNLISKNKETQDRYADIVSKLQVASTKLDAADRRLQDFTASLPGALERAGTDAVREYAKDATSHILGLRADAKRFGQEAAQCSATAYTLKEASDSCAAGTVKSDAPSQQKNRQVASVLPE